MRKRLTVWLGIILVLLMCADLAVAEEISCGRIKVSYDKTAELTISYGDVAIVTHPYYYFGSENGSINISIPSFRGFENSTTEKTFDSAGNETGSVITWKVTTGSNRIKGLADGEQFVKLYLTKESVRFEFNLIPNDAKTKGYGEIGLLVPEDAFAGGSYEGIYVSGSGEEFPRSGDLPVSREPVQMTSKIFKTVELKTGEAAKQGLLMRVAVEKYRKLIVQDFRSQENPPWAGNWRLVGGMDYPLGKDAITIEFEEI